LARAHAAATVSIWREPSEPRRGCPCTACINGKAVAQLIGRAVSEMPKQSLEEVRRLELHRLDALLAAVWTMSGEVALWASMPMAIS
jgi:hypothetical protein